MHPDRYAQAGDAERRASLQLTTRVNEAYRTLKDPVQRAKHILDLNGVDVAFETNTQMPSDFLLKQLEWREELEEAVQTRSADRLDAIRKRLSLEGKAIEAEIESLIDGKKNFAAAVESVRKLMFFSRLDEEIDEAYEEVG